MTEEQERAAFKNWYKAQPNGYPDPWDAWEARAALSQSASPAPEAIAAREAVDSPEDLARKYASDCLKEKHRLAEDIAAYHRARLARRI